MPALQKREFQKMSPQESGEDARFGRTEDGTIQFFLHAGQARAWNSRARFTAIVAGTQSGKTVFGPVWLLREIRERGPGDYLVVTPTFPMLELKALSAFKQVFERALGFGKYTGSPVRRFKFSRDGSVKCFGDGWDGETETVVFFGHAMDPDSLESATAKAAWLDEPGQRKFRLGSWEAVQRRLSIHKGRALLTTTPYNLGWFKQEIQDKADQDPDIEVIQFTSIENPVFPKEEYERQRRKLPGWKFRMYYQGAFERPAGLIYDSFDETTCKIPRFAIPDDWDRLLGLDFGGANMVGVFYAREPETDRLYLYRTYHAGGRTAKEHVRKLLDGERGIPQAAGGSPSEGQWRDEFAAAGLPVREPPISDVELGINRVYGLHKENRILVFDDQYHYFDQKMAYAREMDESGKPTETIEDKEDFHIMDAERYILSWHVHTFGAGESIVIKPKDIFADLSF